MRSRHPDTWVAEDEGHRFHCFWAPVTDLPDIIEPQNTYLDYALEECGYAFP